MPFILKGLFIASAATGIKKAIDAAKDSYEAVKLNRRAQEIFDEAKRELLDARDEAATSLESLGELKLVVWDRSISAFVKVMENVGDRRVRRLTGRKAGGLVKGEPEGHGQVDNVCDIDRRELAQMKLAVLTAGDLVKGGVATLTGGSLLSLVTVKGVQALAAASTGTAIRTLSGIAAKNATLAWLGGGALAAGGKGIAGGLAVLGGIQLAPVFAVSGFVFASRARQNLENAKSNLSQAENLAMTMRTAIDTLQEINTVSATQHRLISKLDAHLLATIDELEPALAAAHNKAADRNARSLLFKIRRLLFGAKTQVKVADLDEYHRILFLESLSCVGLLNRLLMVPLLSESGEITRECKAIAEQAERFVETRVDQYSCRARIILGEVCREVFSRRRLLQ